MDVFELTWILSGLPFSVSWVAHKYWQKIMLEGWWRFGRNIPPLLPTHRHVLSSTKGNQVKICSRVAQGGNTVPSPDRDVYKAGRSTINASCLFHLFLNLFAYIQRWCNASHFRIGQLLSTTGNYWSYSIRLFFSFGLCVIKLLYKGKLEPELRFLWN